MTSQEFEVKRRSRVARIWQNRRERWAAWKAERETIRRLESHCIGEWDNSLPGWRCMNCRLPYHQWEERSCQVVQHTTL